MIRAKQDRTTVIDLTGPGGNAFCLLGNARKFARQLNLDGDAIIEEMKQGNYEHLVSTFDKYFGEYVILER
jgi:hypothetical protein